MIDYYMKLADVIVNVTCQYESTRDFCKDYLDNLDTSDTVDIIHVVVGKDDIEYERGRSKAEALKEGIPQRHFSNEYLETLAVYRRIAQQMTAYDTVLFHGSAVAVDGACYLFTAKSGTGKSTHTRLWVKHFGARAVMVNDDKPLIRVTSDGVRVYGTPWDGKHRISNNISVPLKAICVLERDDTNHIDKVTARSAYPVLLQQTYRPNNQEGLAKTLKLLDNIVHNVDVYRLGCNMQEEAAAVSYDGMK